ncbi:MAG: nucleotide exchange factor GrpE [Prolixibacteraceae bacterium]|nr:nucleotide exchange factor GrpE [Prolixibacteraceae bacterium]MBN2648138.1 nucleotide exchange factor GrpE [Prolixibacteraceae bacterium]
MAEKNKKNPTEEELKEKNAEAANSASEAEDKAEAEKNEKKGADEVKTDIKTKKSKFGKKPKENDKIKELEDVIAQKNDQFLRLQAEFDNYRKRTLKEKMELTKTAGESLLVNILPLMDDFERALQSMNETDKENPIKQGLDLIYKRFSDFLKQNGVNEIKARGEVFDTDLHEAITKIPAPEEDLKGKIVDVIQKGYTLNEKVIRYAKVVIGE